MSKTSLAGTPGLHGGARRVEDREDPASVSQVAPGTATIQLMQETARTRSSAPTAPRAELQADESRLLMMRRVKAMTVEQRLQLFERLSRDCRMGSICCQADSMTEPLVNLRELLGVGHRSKATGARSAERAHSARNRRRGHNGSDPSESSGLAVLGQRLG